MVIHPQSIVHSLVEFVDGSVIAQLEPARHEAADPVRARVSAPRSRASPQRLDWTQPLAAGLRAARPATGFRPWSWARKCAARGGTAGAVLNAANEAAVAGFLAGELHFTEIVPACRSVLESHHFEPAPVARRAASSSTAGLARRYHVGYVLDR